MRKLWIRHTSCRHGVRAGWLYGVPCGRNGPP